MKKILITGSSGYIGQHLCNFLGNSYHITGLDRVFKTQFADRFIEQNILENKDIEGEYDTVIHLAALVQVGGGQRLQWITTAPMSLVP